MTELSPVIQALVDDAHVRLGSPFAPWTTESLALRQALVIAARRWADTQPDSN
jgi:hypothetical protein